MDMVKKTIWKECELNELYTYDVADNVEGLTLDLGESGQLAVYFRCYNNYNFDHGYQLAKDDVVSRRNRVS